MKIYRESIRLVITTAVILALLVAFCWYCNDTLLELVQVSWNLTVGENKPVATPQDRFAYLKAHPDKIKLAMLGSWAEGSRLGKPHINILLAAIHKINQAGGINGREIITDWMDTQGSNDLLNEYVEKIAHDPSYYAVFGPTTSGQLLSVKPLLLAYRLLTFAPAVSNTNASLPGEPPCIFLPNSSDRQDVMVLREWVRAGKRDNFILINENKPFSIGYAQQVDRLFFESEITISARSYFNPADNVQYFQDELKNYAEYLDIHHALIINESSVPGSYERLAKWMLANGSGDVFSYKIMKGEFSEAEQKRLFSIVYFDREEKVKLYINELDNIPNGLNDAFAPAVYRSMFLFADGCSQAKTLYQDDVINVLCQNELKTPFGAFHFDESRFEKDPVIRIVSVYQLVQDWDRIMTTYRKK